jgi:hypothetical protein
MKILFLQHSREKFSNIKSDENPSIESWVIPSERTDGRMEGRKNWQTDRQTDRQINMTKLIVAFRNLVKTLKNQDKFLNTTSFVRKVLRLI